MLQPRAACLVARARCVRALRVDLAGTIRDGHPAADDEAYDLGQPVLCEHFLPFLETAAKWAELLQRDRIKSAT